MQVKQLRSTPAAMLLLTAVVMAACGSATSTNEPTAGPSGSPRNEDAPEMARITCTKRATTKLKNKTVAMQRDGVHVEVDNRAGEPVSIYGLPIDSSEGIERHVVQEPPGVVKVGCAPYSMHGDNYDPKRVALEIVDPGRHWVDAELECPPGDDLVQSTVHDYFGDPAAGERGDVVEIARRRVKRERESDVFERAGAPASSNATVRVVRDQYVIALLHFDQMEQGGWILGSDSSCASSGLRIS